MTYLQLIKDAYEDIGFLSKAKPDLDGRDQATALRTLQRVLGLYSEEPNFIPNLVRSTFLTALQQSFLVGASDAADVDNARPLEIKSAYIRDASNVDYPLRVKTVDQYARLGQKTVSQRPTELYYVPTYPDGTIYFDSTPITAAETCIYWAEEPFAEPAKLSETISLSPAFRHMLLCDMRLQLAAKKHMPIDPYWVADWRRTKAAITTQGSKSRTTVSVPDIGVNHEQGDILTDYR